MKNKSGLHSLLIGMFVVLVSAASSAGQNNCPSLPITISLPNNFLDPSVPSSTVIIAPVTATLIDNTTTNGANITGCQGDFTFDSSVITFDTPPVQRAGLTSDPNWNVVGSILNTGPGTIKTLRISAFMSNFVGLHGSGTCFEVRIRRVSNTVGAMSPLIWAPRCGGNEFIYIDDELNSYDPTQNNGLAAIQGPPVNVDGTITYCSKPVPGPVPSVTLTLTGGASGSTSTDSSGNYLFSGLPSGGTYTVTPSKTQLLPGAAGINTVDVLAVQQHFLSCDSDPNKCLTGCRLAAADVNGDGSVDTVDVTAINRFFLNQSTGIGNTGKYKLTPVSRTYTGLTANQPAQNYEVFVYGDVASPFVH